jgi:hypothetical protein
VAVVFTIVDGVKFQNDEEGGLIFWTADYKRNAYISMKLSESQVGHLHESRFERNPTLSHLFIEPVKIPIMKMEPIIDDRLLRKLDWHILASLIDIVSVMPCG